MISSTYPPELCATCRAPYEQDEDGEEWEQVCECDTETSESGIVLDPIMRSGTTAVVAKRLGRKFIGFELIPNYVALAQRRAGITVDEPNRLIDDEDTTTLTDFE